MRDIIKTLFIPMAGVTAMALIFILVVWGGSWYDEVVNEKGKIRPYGDSLVGYAVFTPSGDCSDIYDPVCGHNGFTYDNACLAVRDGTRTAYQGACLE